MEVVESLLLKFFHMYFVLFSWSLVFFLRELFHDSRKDGLGDVLPVSFNFTVLTQSRWRVNTL